MSGQSKTLYEVLEIWPSADATEIKRAWRARLMSVHPDHGGTAAETIQVQAAYEVLSDPARRAAYDRRLAEPRPAASASWSVFDDVADEFEDHEAGWSSTMSDAYSAFSDAPTDLDEFYEWLWQMRKSAGLPTCAARTKAGRRCMGTPYRGGMYCYQHTPNADREVRLPRRCRACGMIPPLRGFTTCWDCSTDDQKARARSSRPAGQCISGTSAGRPCGAVPVWDGFCHSHWLGLEASRTVRSASTWPTSEQHVDQQRSHGDADSEADTSVCQSAPTSGTTKDMLLGCGCMLLLGIGLIALVLMIVRWSQVEKMLTAAGNTVLTVIVAMVLFRALLRRRK